MKRTLITILWCIIAIFSWEAVMQYCAPEKDLLAISEVQRELTRRGFPCKIDGIIGPETLQAWRDYEKDSINKSAIYWFKRMEIKPMETKTQSKEKKDRLVTWGFSEHDKAILEDGIQYLYKDELYYLYEGAFHRRHRIDTALYNDPIGRHCAMVWAMICNPDFEKAIFDDGVKVKARMEIK